MRNWFGVSGVACAGVLLAACAAQAPRVSEETQLQQLQSGEASLNCTTLPCQFNWVSQRPNALQMYNSERWRELAVLVMRGGYRNDLTYFYLGRAAEGLNYLTAAEGYYRTSEQLSASELACVRGNNSCDGFTLPDLAEARLRSVQAALAPPPPPPKRVVRRRPTTKSTTSTPASTTAGVYMPPASGAASSAGTAPSTPAGQSSSGGVYLPPQK